jgi:hypothetical protein
MKKKVIPTRIPLDTIVINYWYHKYDDCEYNHLQKFSYSLEKRNELIDYFMNKGYNVI